MFVFKAAVVGAGTMGGQIAQTIAAAGIPVVLKDVKQELVDAGLQEARNVTSGQVGKLVEKGKLTEEQAAAQVEEVLGRIHGATDYEGFGDVDFVDRGGAGADGDQAGGLRRARRLHAGPRDPRVEHLVAVDHRDRRRDAAPRQGRRLPLLLPGVGHAADRDHRGRRHLARTRCGAAVTFAQAIRSSRSPAPRSRASSSTASSTPASSEIWRAQEEQGLSIKKIDEGVGAANVDPDGRRTSWSTCSASTRCCTSPSTCRSPTATASTSRRACSSSSRRASSAPRPAATASTRRPASRTSTATASPTSSELVEMLTLKTFVEACLVLEEGVATHRDIDFGLMAGAGLDPRRGLLPPFMKADVEGLDTVLERLESAARRSTASASRRRRSCGAWSPRAASARSPARASTPTRRPTPSSPPATRPSSSSRRAATSRSPGWPTAR